MDQTKTPINAIAFLLAAVILLAVAPRVAEAGAIGVTTTTGESASREAQTATASALEREPRDVVGFTIPAAARHWWTTTVTLVGCSSSSAPDLRASIETAKGQLASLESGQALSSLEGAIDASSCATAPVDRPDLLLALELAAQAAQDEGDADRAKQHLGQLVAADSSYQLTSTPGSGYDALWNEARRVAGESQSAAVAVQHGTEVFLNGDEVPPEWSLNASLLPGRHLLQWKTPVGWAGGWLTIDAGTEQGAAIMDSALPRLFERGLSDAGARTALKSWLVSLAAAAGLDGIGVSQDKDGGRGFVVEMERSGSWNTRLAGGARKTNKRPDPPRPGVVVGIGLGGGGAVLGGLSVWQFDSYSQRVEELGGYVEGGIDARHALEADRDLARDGGIVFLGSAVAMGTASIVSLVVAAVQQRSAKRSADSSPRK